MSKHEAWMKGYEAGMRHAAKAITEPGPIPAFPTNPYPDPALEGDGQSIFEFDMAQHAMLVAFPFCTVPGSDIEFVGPPTFVSNMPEDRDPNQQMEAALLFALAVIREGKLKSFGDVPDDLSTLKDKE